MSWSGLVSGINGAIDAVESWVAGQSFWIQVPVLLAVLLPLIWLLAGLIDRLVDRILWPWTRRESMIVHPAGHRLARPAADPERPAVGSDLDHR